uniref:DUF2813 domain-containing protein n=2 Tax=Thermofilum TaxID=2268 RepID=A0A7C1CCF6_9CREN
MVIVKSIDIEDFRGVRRLKEPLELGKFNILLGRNCIGKSSILQALFLVNLPCDEVQLPLYTMSSKSYLKALSGKWNYLIYGYSGDAHLTFKLQTKGLRKAVVTKNFSTQGEFSSASEETLLKLGKGELNLKIFLSASTESVNCKIDEENLTQEKLRELAIMLNPEGQLLGIYIPNDTNFYKLLHEYAYKNMDGITKRGLHVKVFQEFLRETISDKFTEVFPRENELYARKELKDTVLYIRLNDLGEGVKRGVLTFFAIEYLNPAIILWDDIEVAAHPSLLDATIKWLTESERQVVLSTHSVDVLESFVRVEPRDAKVIMLKKDKEDIITYKSLTLDEVEDLLDKGIDPRKIVEGTVP